MVVLGDARLSVGSIIKGIEELDAEDQAYLEDYFRQFLAPGKPGDGFMVGSRCRCGKPLTGYLGTFTYSIVHGEGYCSSCHWPCVSHHYVKDGAGNEILRLAPIVLLVHPSLVEVKQT